MKMKISCTHLLLGCFFVVAWFKESPIPKPFPEITFKVVTREEQSEAVPSTTKDDTLPPPPSTQTPEPTFEERLVAAKVFASKVSNNQFLEQSKEEMKRTKQEVNLTRLGRSEWYIQDNLHAGSSNSKNKDEEPCIVYSFGIAERDEYTELMSQKGCHVFAMDPTVHHPTDWMPNVTFYPWGLANRATAGAKNWSHPIYGTITGKYMTLPEIVKKLGHTDKTIAAMKLDCEGCEFAAFREMMDEAVPAIRQIDVEFHFASTLGMVDEQDAARMYYADVYLKAKQCYLVRQRKNYGFKHDQFKVQKPLVDAGVDKRACCYEMTYACGGED